MQKGERMEPRSTDIKCARRTLFGPVDPSQLQQDFQCMLSASMERAKQKWNFDFLQEVPAEGLLQWEELQEQEVPAFYHTCIVGGARKPLQPVNRTVAQEAQTRLTVKLREKARPAKKTGGKKSQARKKRRQTSLTDYYTTKKQVKMEMQTPEKKLAF
ncbi:PREDICTED: cyclin-dependent kinase inhibitor 1-like isoform X2 [Gekko japonicus]|uniref:Cyclin-dependent kinase inhibitor 1-like isoform X2 n=1 Tax=Gekko japonicus TaxID=146911 RepID=A0ABM1K1K8_GEKJA|nr:PREDICTED: cyclin-dependent kinase inhibitor 1-like isoform X2 [Gekko japonicus]